MAVSLEIFVKQLEDSGIIAGSTLKDFIPPKADPKDAEELARELVRSKKLTPFQAEEVSKGNAKSLVLGNYVLTEKIGAGGMGQVFKAEHRRMHRTVAVKVLPTNTMKDPATIARFEREVTAAAKLEHPNIVAAHDADEANGVHFLVMQYVEGQDLSALVKKNGPFSIQKAVNCLLQAAKGLEFAHKKGIVHRDIKPANLLLDIEGTVKILDMGLARIDMVGEVDVATQAELTGTGSVMGTVDYMSPEQAFNAKHADARADIYSLGCTLYYLIAGKPTYSGESVIERILAHREKPIPSLKIERPDASDQLEAVFTKMVAKKVEDRYQTMGEVIAELGRLRMGQAGAVSELAQTIICTSSSQLLPETEVTKISPSIGATVQTPKFIKSNGKNKVIYGTVAAVFVGAIVLVWISIVHDSSDGTAAKPPTNEQRVSVQPRELLAFEKPGFDLWVKEVQALSAEKQVEAVSKKLMELNPGFDGKGTLNWSSETPLIENGVVREFGIESSKVTDISPIRVLTGLQAFVASGSGYGNGILSDLSPLKGMSITRLNLNDNPRISNLSPLNGLPLTHLSICSRIVSWPPAPSPLSDLTPLKGMSLRALFFGGTSVSDLSPLKGMPLWGIQCWTTKVTDLSPLHDMKLENLNCLNTRISNLAPLNGMPIRDLNIGDTLVTDLSPLVGMPLKDLRFTPKNITLGIDVIRQMNSIETFGIAYSYENFTPEEFWKNYDAGEFGTPPQ